MTDSTETRSFHIGDILSVTTGMLVSTRHVGGVADVLQWMTGETLWTHQLPRACEECAPALRRQFPELAAIEVPEGLNSEEKVLSWLGGLEPEYGTHRDVAPLPPQDHTSIDPLTEMRMNHPRVRIVPVTTPADGLADIRDATARVARAAEALRRAFESMQDDGEGSQA